MKTSLQARLIILMALASVFLISAFTAIQLNNQLKRAHEFNIFKAKEGAFVVMQSLLEIFTSVDAADLEGSRTHAIIEIKKAFAALREAGMFETAVLLDKENTPLVLEGDLKLFFEEEKGFLERILKQKDESKWLVPLVDKKHRIVSLFIAIENPYDYVVKLSSSLANLEQALREVYGPVVLTVIIVVFGNVILATLLSRVIISPIKLFNEATKDVAGGNLDKKVSIKTEDELQELANTFNYMSDELKKMRARAENANPLTKLPGNIVIREEVEKKIKEHKKFLLIYSDLDNFKAFNDKYGVEAGDRAIMLSADIFRKAIAEAGKVEEDFLGHEGGDDFLLLTVPGRAQKIADNIMNAFDKRVRELYDKEDLKRGYIESKARDSNEIKKFPVMTISLAGVGNVQRKISSYAQVTNIAAELKHVVKESEGSNFVMDRRRDDRGIGFRKADEPSEEV
ncbi:diguanylate cyclase [Omnitrophica bacterium]|nr:diguanylate cyclase [Candidatus Omnitrophota bacterium]